LSELTESLKEGFSNSDKLTMSPRANYNKSKIAQKKKSSGHGSVLKGDLIVNPGLIPPPIMFIPPAKMDNGDEPNCGHHHKKESLKRIV
jgi:hypothetical protein